MLKTWMLTLTLLVSAAWLQAQQYPKTGSDQTGSTKSSQTKVEGCLQASNGNFTLTLRDHVSPSRRHFQAC
jgi:hypothetical protein